MKSRIANQKYSVFILSVVLIVSFSILENSYGADLDVGEARKLRLIYFLPNNRSLRTEVIQQLKDEIRSVQSFYAEQMQTQGYPNRTFHIETDVQGQPIVHQVDGQHPENIYGYTIVLDEIGQVFDLNKNIYLIVIDNGKRHIDFAGGRGGNSGKNAGWVIFPDSYLWQTMAHELGHAFGIQHDFRNGDYIMSYGPGQNQLSACGAGYLAKHPYFNTDIPIEAGQPPTIELVSPLEYQTDSESVSVQLKINSPIELHQVTLFVKTREPHFNAGALEVKACHKLIGEKDALVEFDYDGITPSDNRTSLGNPILHPIYVEAMDINGNIGRIDFSLVESLTQELLIKRPKQRGAQFAFSAAFSPDGRTLAWGLSDNTIRLWDVATGENTATLFGHRAWVLSVAFSPDGKTLASGSYEWDQNTVRLWDIATEREILKIDHSGRVASVAFSPDGTILASAAGDEEIMSYTVKLWDVATGEKIATYPHNRAPRTVAFSPDGATLASGAYDLTVKLWDVATGESIDSFMLNTPVESVAFSPDNTTLAVGDWDKVTLWNLETGQHIATLNGHTHTIRTVAFSTDGTLLATGSDDKIQLWDATTRLNLATYDRSTSDTLSSIDFSPDTTTLALASSNSIVLWELSEFRKTSAEVLTEVNIPDPNLRSAITTSLGLTTIAPILRGNMLNLTRLFVNNSSIEDLTGLEFATNLQYLYFMDNAVSDISPLAELTNLTSLWFSNNSVSDISPLAKLTNLTSLLFADNLVSDISSLAGLTNLTSIWFHRNSVSDISPLEGLTDLTSILFHSNLVSDISPLVANTTLGSGVRVNFQNNPLSYASIQTHIPILQERGVTVDFDDRSFSTILKISGDNQEGAPSELIPNPLVVEVQDENGLPYEGVTVTFAITEGGGILSVTSTKTDENGRTESTLTLGKEPGTNTVKVMVAGIDSPVFFNAIAIADEPSLEEDVNEDGVVDIRDLVLVASQFGETGENNADVNGDGVVNIQDLVLVASAFGNEPKASAM